LHFVACPQKLPRHGARRSGGNFLRSFEPRKAKVPNANRHMSSSIEERINRILIVSLDNLGDVVFASSLAQPLRDRFPRAAIDLWCKTYTADVARLIPHVRDVVASDPFWDRAPGRGKGALLPFLGALRRVRAARYDVAVFAAAPWRTAAAVAATRVPKRIGLARRRNERFLTHALAPEDIHRPVLQEMARVLEPLGIRVSVPRYRLEESSLSDRVRRLEQSLGTQPAGRGLVALHPFASKRDRCVALDVWRSVARVMSSQGFTVLWIGSSAELDELRAANSVAAWRFIDRAGDGTLADTAAALSMATLFAGHDSGPLHIAGAFGVPVLGVFAPGEPERTFPQGVGAWRMIAKPSPGDVSDAEIVEQLAALSPLRARPS